MGVSPANLAAQEYSLARTSFLAAGSMRELETFVKGLPKDLADSPAGLRWRASLSVLSGEESDPLLPARAAAIQDDDAPQSGPGGPELSDARRLAANGQMAAARERLGDLPSQLRERLRLEPTDDGLWATLGGMEALLGNKDEAVSAATRAVELATTSRGSRTAGSRRFNLALVHAWTGDKDRAIADIGQLLRTPYGAPNVHIVRNAPSTFPLHGDPRFEALLNDPKNNAPLFRGKGSLTPALAYINMLL